MESFPVQYAVRVVSGLPKGSGCSMFDGYAITRHDADEIAIRLTHHETTAQAIMCTADYPYVETIIPLGSDFAPGLDYTVRVNGLMQTFTAE